MSLFRIPHFGSYSFQQAVKGIQNAPPVSPAKGDRYIVGNAPAGAWIGYGWNIATYTGSGWIFDQPAEGWLAYSEASSNLKLYSAAAWANLPTAAHAASHQAGGSDVVDADTVDTKHASDFATASHNHDSTYAPSSKGVTNGDTHDHVGGDGAAIAEGALSLADVTTGDVDTSKHGFVPKAPNDTSKFLRGDGTWAAPGGGGLGYVLPVFTTNITSVADLATLYFGNYAFTAQTSPDTCRIYIPKTGTIKVAEINVFSTTVGSNENVSLYIRLNNTTDTLIQTRGMGAANALFSNTGLNISVSAGDYIEIKMVCPTWATNPAAFRFGGSIYIE